MLTPGMRECKPLRSGQELTRGFAQKPANASTKGAQYESQGQAPNNVRRVAPGKSALIREALKKRNIG